MSQIKLEFIGTPYTVNSVIKIFIDGVEKLETCKTSRVNPFEVGTAIPPFKTAFKNAFNTDYNTGGLLFTYIETIDTLTIVTTDPLVQFTDFQSDTGIVATITNAPLPEPIDLRVRSPYLLISTGDTATTFTNTSYVIKQYEDELNSFSTQPISYLKSKSKIVNGQNNIWVNISNLVKEDLESDVSYYKDIDYTTARNLSLNESKWVNVKTSLYYITSFVYSADTFYFVTDGYIEPNQTQGLPNILMTGNKRYLYKGSNERIYFKTNNLTGATYTTSENPTPTNITFSGDLTYNYGYVKSVKVDNSNLNTEWASYNFNYASAATENVTVYFYDECRYDNYDLVFKNKYGILETLSMSKKSSKAININSTDYLRSIVDYEGDFNINRHTSKQFNVTGNEEWILNTDFLPEYMNQPIKEAMLTEEMWLIDSAGNIIPVIKQDSSLAFKTSLNDKMIQYTVKVKQSHNTINNII